MYIKKLKSKEISTALDLVWCVFKQFEAPDYSERGVSTFKSFINDKSIMMELDFYGAFANMEILGIIAIKNFNHITMLFVKKEHQRKGVAKALIRHILDMNKQEILTVNSSPYAVEIYHKMGFVDTDSEKEVDGIRFTPMQYTKSITSLELAKSRN